MATEPPWLQPMMPMRAGSTALNCLMNSAQAAASEAPEAVAVLDVVGLAVPRAREVEADRGYAALGHVGGEHLVAVAGLVPRRARAVEHDDGREGLAGRA